MELGVVVAQAAAILPNSEQNILHHIFSPR